MENHVPFSEVGTVIEQLKHAPFLCKLKEAYDNELHITILCIKCAMNHEDIYLKDYTYPREARTGISQYLNYYNNERLHQSLGSRTPSSLYYGR